MNIDKYDLIDSRLKFGNDMAILTYQLFLILIFIDKEYDGIQRVVYFTQDYIKPMQTDFTKVKKILKKFQFY